MKQNYYILVLCLLLGGSICSQVEGSADGAEDDEAASGFGSDDEDTREDSDEDLSGYEPKSAVPKTKCQKVREQMLKKPMPGAYEPRCTDQGLFEKIQCHGSTGECWCVDENGYDIKGTVQKAPNRPNCDNIVVAPARPEKPKGGYIDNSPEEEVGFEKEEDVKNKINPIPETVEIIKTPGSEEEEAEELDNNILQSKQEAVAVALIGQPGILAAIIGGAVVGLLCAVLLVMFIVYRMRKKDEGSYALDEPKRSPQHAYTRAKNQEFFA